MEFWQTTDRFSSAAPRRPSSGSLAAGARWLCVWRHAASVL